MAKRVNSRAKGARGEVELAHWLTERGFTARRGQQFSGGGDSPDVVCERLKALGVQVECKRVEKLEVYKALAQAQRDAGGTGGVVFHRKNNQQWIVVMDAEKLLELLRSEEAIRRMIG